MDVATTPTLLRWFTGHAPKSGDPRKLMIAKEENGIVFFEEQDLLSFNEWLRLPWPHKPGKRPNIPAGIYQASALSKISPFVLSKTDPHQEHDLPVGKTVSSTPKACFILPTGKISPFRL